MTYVNKKAILKVGVIIILGVVLASATISAGVLADAPAESEYSDILNNTDGDGTLSNPYVLTKLDELQAVQGDLSSHYVLGNDINASETEMWNSGAGFKPIGSLSNSFSGNFDGKGYTVDGLYINRPNIYRVGLFGIISSDIKNIGVTNIDIQGMNDVGGLVGFTEGSTTITNSFSSGNVSGGIEVGGLVGAVTNTTIEKSYSHSSVNGNYKVGGLVGENILSSNITQSYSTGAVSGNSDVGGLVGHNRDSSNITKSYSHSNVSGDSPVGGLVGENVYGGSITQSYSTGAVSGNSDVGGLVGENRDSSNITKSYSTGLVSGNSDVGGLLGYNDDSTVKDSYWNVETSNKSTSAGSAIGLTTADMTGSEAATNMVGFDFKSEWRTVSASDADSAADSYPIILDSSEEEEAVIVSESSSEEYGGMSTLVSVALLFVLFSVMVLLLVKD